MLDVDTQHDPDTAAKPEPNPTQTAEPTTELGGPRRSLSRSTTRTDRLFRGLDPWVPLYESVSITDAIHPAPGKSLVHDATSHAQAG